MSQLLNNIHLIIKKLNKANPYKNFTDLADFVGFSSAGLHDSLKNNSIKVRTLEKICEFYDISIVDLMKRATQYSNQESMANEPDNIYRTKDEIKLLEEKLALRNEQIEHYKEILKHYQNQEGSNRPNTNQNKSGT